MAHGASATLPIMLGIASRTSGRSNITSLRGGIASRPAGQAHETVIPVTRPGAFRRGGGRLERILVVHRVGAGGQVGERDGLRGTDHRGQRRAAPRGARRRRDRAPVRRPGVLRQSVQLFSLGGRPRLRPASLVIVSFSGAYFISTSKLGANLKANADGVYEIERAPERVKGVEALVGASSDDIRDSARFHERP